MFTNINERMRPLFRFVHLTKQMTYLVRICSFIKRTNFPSNGSRLFAKRSVHLQP
ncbi:hypothetical protein Hanom_Chr04g00324561 [Helianthus anomalus]